MRKLLVLAGLAGVATVVAKKMRERQAQPVWHTPDTDADRDVAAEPPLQVVPDSTPHADDAAGAGPDEALADAAEEPHIATTPDAPLQEDDVPKD